MRGVVSFINEEFGLVAVETEHGEFTVFGLLEDSSVALGDVISGDLEALDHQTLENETRRCVLTVYVEDTELSLEHAREKVS
ncbi:MAG: hypothetical protein JJU06_01140 [Ectothiorhodospiraceae bacterium]|nr:hypothetical protein [Ectothiorhodospiraceae bacterium]MCH8505606.1 hypothetical protein [Ectothiorhodospiraceae bacterium]